MEYPKTENLWARNPDDPKSPMTPDNGVRVEEVGLVDRWLVLEKIDGMNMRVLCDFTPMPFEAPVVSIYGRTDRAQIPGDLMARMQEYFSPVKMTTAFDRSEPGEPEASLPGQVVLFGEGYGPGIQQGGHYRDDKDFTLFDVVIDGHWCRWDTVEAIAATLGIETVPVLGRNMSTDDVNILVSSMCGSYSDPEWRGQLWHRPWPPSGCSGGPCSQWSGVVA